MADNKIVSIIMTISILFVLLIGTFGVIYKIFILDKSIIPDYIYNVICITGYVALITLIICIMINKKTNS